MDADAVTAAAGVVRATLGERRAPRLALVLGSGLGSVADAVEEPVVVPYGELPGFPAARVAGHGGRLVVGRLEGAPVVVLDGRAHLYEGVPAAALGGPVRVVHALGAEAVVLTNAAGSLRPEVGPGRLMALSDHINLTGANPLAGPPAGHPGSRFVGMGGAYDAGLRAALHRAAAGEGLDLAEGVYVAVLGPSFETAAEIRAFRALGADAVGMSTVPEVIVARQCGMRVAAVSAITNLAEGLGDAPLSHEHTLAAAASAASDLERLLRRFAATHAGV